jgi:hypothetical protein
MRRIVFSCFGQTDDAYKDYVLQLKGMHEMYSDKYKIPVMTVKEIEFLDFLVDSFDNSGQMPNQSLFENNFPETQGSFDSIPILLLADFRVYVYNFIQKRGQ